MAVLVRTRRLSNPAKRRRVAKRNPARKRKMSPKQIAIFGTARQKAALKASRSRKRRTNAGFFSARKSKKRTRKFGATRAATQEGKLYRLKAKRTKAVRRRRKNIGEIVSISLAGLNPGRKRRRNTGMAKRRRRVRKAVANPTRRRRTYRRRRHAVANPVRRRRRVSHRRRAAVSYRRRRRGNPTFRIRRIRRRRNAGVSRSMGGLTSGLIGKLVGLIGGAVSSKYLTQAVLGGNNTGLFGYAGNIVSSVALGWAAGKVTKSKEFGTNVMVGGLLAVALRGLMDFTSVGQYINLSLAGVGKGGDLGLGIIEDSSFPVPQTFAPGSMTKAVIPSATRGYVSAQIAQSQQMKAAGSGGMGAMRGRSPRRAIM